MGNATSICSDKTGTLTTSKMTVSEAYFCNTLFTKELLSDENTNQRKKSQDPDLIQFEDSNDNNITTNTNNSSMVSTKSLKEIKDNVPHNVWNGFIMNAIENTTVFIREEDKKKTTELGPKAYEGSPTEVALVQFAISFDESMINKIGGGEDIIKRWPFSSKVKRMMTLIRISTSNSYKSDMDVSGESLTLNQQESSHSRSDTNTTVVNDYHPLQGKSVALLVKGAPEKVLNLCYTIYTGENSDSNQITDITDTIRHEIKSISNDMASRGHRVLGLAIRYGDDEQELIDTNEESTCTFIGLIAIEDPVREGVRKSIDTCRRAGVIVRMVTGDGEATARNIATKCGVLGLGGIVMEGPEFQKRNDDELLSILPKLQVLARSSPDDKKRLVGLLKQMGEVVAVTGDGTNDAPALKLADIGFSMGSGTNVAKKSSSIVLLHDDFPSIVTAMAWGRAVNDSVRRFLQFQLTVNVTAVIVAFVSALIGEGSVLTAVQLLWVKMFFFFFFFKFFSLRSNFSIINISII